MPFTSLWKFSSLMCPADESTADRPCSEGTLSSPVLVYICKERILYVAFPLSSLYYILIFCSWNGYPLQAQAHQRQYRITRTSQCGGSQRTYCHFRIRVLFCRRNLCCQCRTKTPGKRHTHCKIMILTSQAQTLEAKKIWNKHFFAHLNNLDKQKPVIWAGDFNVAPTARDLANPKSNWNKTAGYTEAETTAFNKFLNPPINGEGGDKSDEPGKFVDVWRDLHPDERGYTYFSYRFNCRMKGIGWRIDGCTSSSSAPLPLYLLICCDLTQSWQANA